MESKMTEVKKTNKRKGIATKKTAKKTDNKVKAVIEEKPVTEQVEDKEPTAIENTTFGSVAEEEAKIEEPIVEEKKEEVKKEEEPKKVDDPIKAITQKEDENKPTTNKKIVRYFTNTWNGISTD